MPVKIKLVKNMKDIREKLYRTIDNDILLYLNADTLGKLNVTIRNIMWVHLDFELDARMIPMYDIHLRIGSRA